MRPLIVVKNLSQFPNEILWEILSYLSVYDLGRLSQTSRRFRQICLDETLWNGIEEYLIKDNPAKFIEMGESSHRSRVLRYLLKSNPRVISFESVLGPHSEVLIAPPIGSRCCLNNFNRYLSSEPVSSCAALLFFSICGGAALYLSYGDEGIPDMDFVSLVLIAFVFCCGGLMGTAVGIMALSLLMCACALFRGLSMGVESGINRVLNWRSTRHSQRLFKAATATVTDGAAAQNEEELLLEDYDRPQNDV